MGHKLSFAYAEKDATQAQLRALAAHICDTEQTLCSSCQGIYVNAADKETVVAFAQRFVSILDEAAREDERELPPGIQAQVTLNGYTEVLEAVHGDAVIFKTDRCSVTAEPDSALRASNMFRNPWVKPLPAQNIVAQLKPNKNYLQTAALLCAQEDREILSAQLVKAGVVRVCGPGNMAEVYCGMPHDGEYALRRYMKRVSVQG